MKKILALALVLAMVLTLSSCGIIGELSKLASDLEGLENGEPIKYNQEYIDANLGDNYRIAYKITTFSTDGDNSTATWETIRTADGFLVIADDNEGLLYIKNGDNYDVYAKNEEDNFIFSGISHPKETAESSLGMAYFMSYNSYATGMRDAGTETIAGRKCDKFEYSIGAFGVGVSWSYSIDQETGVCLKQHWGGSAGGNAGSVAFECTKFQKGGVTLPEYVEKEEE